MSLRALLTKLKEDHVLREKLKKSTCLDSTLAVAREAGFEVTKADLLKHASTKEHLAELNVLSDDEVEAVAGGAGQQCKCLSRHYK